MSADEESIHYVSLTIAALNSGQLRTRPSDDWWVKQLHSVPRGITGLIDISGLSPEVIRIARAAGMAIQMGRQLKTSTEKFDSDPQLQRTLFGHFEFLFHALVGTASGRILSPLEIKDRMLNRLRHEHDTFAREVNKALDEIGSFYNAHGRSMFKSAQGLGGMKVVFGGQRQFGPSALSAARISGLYCDTQLIPDPVYPFLSGKLHLNALHLQLAVVLFHLLPLRPLVDIQVYPPPIWIFPSFEEPLEESDAATQAGLADLALKVIGPICNAKFESIDNLLEFAKNHEEEFLDSVSREGLFIPPNGDPSKQWRASDAISHYLKELEGIREESNLRMLRSAPKGILVLNGLLERLRPQYHLLENSKELEAQPLLTQDAHWFYFERCAQAHAKNLAHNNIVPQSTTTQLRSLQDNSLSWLSNIPISDLAKLRERMEHVEFREKLSSYTTQLSASNETNIETVLKEVRHGIESMIQQHRKAMLDLQEKYIATIRIEVVGAAAGGTAGAVMSFLPFLAQYPHLTPIASGIAALGTGGLSAIKETEKLLIDRRHLSRKTLLGMLATARGRGNR